MESTYIVQDFGKTSPLTKRDQPLQEWNSDFGLDKDRKKRLLARILTKARKRLTRFDKKVCKFKEKDPG